MAVENVVIKITTTASTRQVRQARNELLQLAKAGQLGTTTQKSLQQEFDKFDKKLKMMKGTLKTVTGAIVSLNKVAIKLFTIGFAVGSAALAANNALFAAGKFLAKGYTLAMQGLAVAVASVGAAAAVAAAAFSEYTAAVNAYAFKQSTALNGRLSESSAALRNIESDATLATFGVQALAGAFASISKNAQVTGVSKTLLKGLADFAAAGGDPAKNLQAAGEFIGLLQKAGNLDSKAIKAAEGIGPTFVEALKKARSQGVSTLSEFTKMLTSGELARLGGVEGQAGIVGQTLMGQFKAFMVELKVLGSDFGQILLGPVKGALEAIGRILKSTIARVGPDMIAFAKGPGIRGLVRIFEVISNFTVDLMRKYLPGANGMMAKFVTFWNQTVYVIKDVVARLRSLLPGGKAVIEAFGKPFMEVFKTVGKWIRYIGDSIRKNQAKYNAFGQALTNFVLKLQELGKKFIDTFTEALPFLENMVNWATTLLDKIMSLVDAVGLLGRGLGGIVNLLGGQGDGLGGAAKIFGIGITAAILKYKIALMRGIPFADMSMMAQVGGKVVQGGKKIGPAINNAGGNIVNNYQQMGYAPVGGPQAAALGRLPRMANAYRGAGRGGAGFPGRVKAANTARMRYNAQHPSGGFLKGMGPAAMLGIGSMFVAPEAQGSMQTGAAIASLAPMLGAAGPMAALAGVGIAGYGMMQNSRTAGGGALGGAMTGAAIGGAIGTVIPVIGTAAGAIVGAIAGTVVGFVKGRSNGEKIKVETAIDKYMGEQLNAVAAGLVQGRTSDIRTQLKEQLDRAKYISDINEQYFQGDNHGRGDRKDTAKRLVQENKITQAEADALIAAPGTYARELTESGDLLNEVVTPMLEKFDQAAGVAAKTLGITTNGLIQLASVKGVDLYDQTTTLRDKFVQLGLAMNYTAEQVVGAMRDIAVNGVEGLMSRIERNMSPQRMDEITEGLYQDFQSGAVIGQDQMGQYVNDMLNQLNIISPDTPLRNVGQLVALLGPNGTLFRAGNQLEGMGDAFGPFSDMIATMGNDTKKEAATELTDMIVKQGLFAGVAFDRDDIQTQLSGLSLSQLSDVSTALANGVFNPELLTGLGSPTHAGSYSGSKEVLDRDLGKLGIYGADFTAVDPSAMTPDQMLAMYGEEGMAIVHGMGSVVSAAFQNTPNWYTDAPEWFSIETFKSMLDPNGDGYIGDTRTPRGDTTSSRLGRTLRRHDYMDGMLTGKRNMTSSFRTDNLGSINSDHITGRAYDLTGQNLGAYSEMVNRSGGFAEFHGRGGGRHLHVVPGETPVGDNTAPYMGNVASSGGSSSSTNNYNITVQGSPGMDVNQLADAVMARLQRVERSNRERV